MDYIAPFDAAAPDEAYIDRDLGTGTPGSKVPALFYNVINAELLALIEGAGLVPDAEDLTQVLQAIQALAGANDLLIPAGTTMASAATTNIGAGDSDFFDISGTTTINSLGTGTDYNHVWVRFQSALTITYNATSLILPTGASIVTEAGDIAEFERLTGGNWICLNYTRASGQSLRPPLGAKGSTIASAATTNIGSADSSHVEISGATTITSLGTGTARDHVWVEFQGALTLTHNATTLILPTGANIVTAAGDCAEFVRTAAGANWRCINYQRASGYGLREMIGSGTTAGGTTAYTITTTPAFTSLVSGQSIVVKMNAANTGAVTLDPNGIGATGVKDAFGNALVSGALENGKTYLFTYDGANFRVITLAGGFDNYLLHVRDEKSSGTDYGSITSSTWTARNLNTVVTNEISGASLASNQITLPAGTYYIDASAPTRDGGSSGPARLRLYNVTDAAALLYGDTVHSQGSTNTEFNNRVRGRITIAGTKVLELQHYKAGGGTNNGGIAMSLAGIVEIYAEAHIWKVK